MSEEEVIPGGETPQEDPLVEQEDKAAAEKPAIRWWPAIVILVFDILATGWIFFNQETAQPTIVMLCQLVALIFLVLWFAFLSRVETKHRMQVIGGVAALVLLFFLVFKMEGVSGDVIPSFSWRWENLEKTKVLNLSKEIKTKPEFSYPQYLGPNRNAIVTGVKLARDWQKNPPKLVWRIPVGAGWSSFAVVGKFAITQEQHDKQEKVVCYELSSGKEIWSYGYDAHHYTALGGLGPRATPTIEGNRVYSLGATGVLTCLELTSGKHIWSKNILEENHSENVEWGKSCSPLIHKNMLIVSAGGSKERSLVAYDKETGKLIWGAGNDQSSYSSPLFTTLLKIPQILIFNQNSITAHNPQDGKILWQYPWGKTGSPNVAQPIPIDGDKVFVGSSYQIGSALLQIQTTKDNKQLYTKKIWTTRRLKPKFTNLVYKEGYFYGLDEGVLCCIDAKNGKRLWRAGTGGRYGHGQVLLVGDLLLVQSEKKFIALIQPDSKEFKELARFPTIDGINWNTPALVGRYLIVRNNKLAACYELPLEKQESD